MKIHYDDGRTTEAVLLSRTESSIRVATPGAEDTAIFREVDGQWLSEGGERVTVEFAWSHTAEEPLPTMEDCICAPELATELLRLLASPERPSDAESEQAAAVGLARAERANWAALSVR